MGIWIGKVSKNLGEDITEEWGSSWNKHGGSLIFWGGCFCFLWGCTITGWHEHGSHPQDTSDMWAKAEYHHSQTTVFSAPPHPPYPSLRICNHFPKPCHLWVPLSFSVSSIKVEEHNPSFSQYPQTSHMHHPATVCFSSVLTLWIKQVEGEERVRLPPAFAFLTLSSCHCYDEK